MDYKYNLVSAHIVCSLGDFAAEAAILDTSLDNEGCKKSIAAGLAYRLKADPTQRLFRHLTQEQVFNELIGEKYAWRIFRNPLDQ
jgi:hypothetical protein